MRITIPLTVEVSENGSINDVEVQVMEASRVVLAEALQTYVTAYEEGHKLCPFCSGTDIHRTGTDHRVLSLRVGRVELSFHRWRCQSCKQRFRLADGLLTLLESSTQNDKSKSKQRAIANGHQPKPYVTAVMPGLASAEAWEACYAWQEFPR